MLQTSRNSKKGTKYGEFLKKLGPKAGSHSGSLGRYSLFICWLEKKHYSISKNTCYLDFISVLFRRFTVKWLSDDKVDVQSVWNLVPRNSDEQPEIILSHTEISDKESTRLINILAAVISKQIPEVAAYNREVEDEFREEYEQTISYPTNLTKIKDRLETNFYR